jgi:alpha-galactosidase
VSTDLPAATRLAEAVASVPDMTSFYRHGWHSWSPTGWVSPDEIVRPISNRGRRLSHDDPLFALETSVSGSGFGVGRSDDGHAVLLGSLDPGARVLPANGTLVGKSELPDPHWVVIEGSVQDVFAAYASELVDHLGGRRRGHQRVWCSWYSYYADVTADAIEAEIDAAGDLGFDVIQIDDGWQAGVGDWIPAGDFAGRMPELAEHIVGSGRRAGLWLAPFVARSDSLLATTRPELLLRDEEGSPVTAGINWGGPYFALDTTSSATQEYVASVIAEVRQWGFDYLKLDFMYAAAFPGRHESPMAREAAYRNGLSIVREAAGDDCYLLACGAPIIASVGIADGIRLGPDGAEFWHDPQLTALADFSGRGARNAIATSSQRLWLRDILDVDPDVVYIDESEHRLESNTVDALVALAQITGFTVVSDRLGGLSVAERLRLASLLDAKPEVVQRDWGVWSVDGSTFDFPKMVGEDSELGRSVA